MAKSNTARASEIAQTLTACDFPFLTVGDDCNPLLTVPIGVSARQLIEQAVFILAGTSVFIRLAEQNELMFAGGQPAADAMTALDTLIAVASGMARAAYEAQAAGGAQ